MAKGIKAGSMKWQAGPGKLYCEKERYQMTESSLILPGDKTKVLVFRVLSVGPDVTGYDEGDVVATGNAYSVDGIYYFVEVKSILGRLVPLSAPNSAIGVLPVPEKSDGMSAVPD